MELFKLLTEELLNEISTADAYSKFYSSIPQEDYESIISGENKMTPLLTFILNAVNNGESVQDAKSIVDLFKQKDDETRKSIVSQIKTAAFKNLKSLKSYLENTEKTYDNRKVFYENGYVELYQDEIYKVTACLTYEACAHYYGDTHWCTSSDRFGGEYDGYKMFLKYTHLNESGGYCVLFQFINLNSREKSVQFAIDEYGRAEESCNFYDARGYYKDEFAIVEKAIGSKEKIENLISKMIDLHEKEDSYQKEVYEKEKEKTLNKVIKALVQREMIRMTELPIKGDELAENILNKIKNENYEDLNTEKVKIIDKSKVNNLIVTQYVFASDVKFKVEFPMEECELYSDLISEDSDYEDEIFYDCHDYSYEDLCKTEEFTYGNSILVLTQNSNNDVIDCNLFINNSRKNRIVNFFNGKNFNYSLMKINDNILGFLSPEGKIIKENKYNCFADYKGMPLLYNSKEATLYDSTNFSPIKKLPCTLHGIFLGGINVECFLFNDKNIILLDTTGGSILLEGPENCNVCSFYGDEGILTWKKNDGLYNVSSVFYPNEFIYMWSKYRPSFLSEYVIFGPNVIPEKKYNEYPYSEIVYCTINNFRLGNLYVCDFMKKNDMYIPSLQPKSEVDKSYIPKKKDEMINNDINETITKSNNCSFKNILNEVLNQLPTN